MSGNNRRNINKLAKVIEQQSQHYTDKILQKQTLEAASKAWGMSDYSTFIKNLDKINSEELPESYKIKYRIAKAKLNIYY